MALTKDFGDNTMSQLRVTKGTNSSRKVEKTWNMVRGLGVQARPSLIGMFKKILKIVLNKKESSVESKVKKY